MKKGYTLPRPQMENADLARIINSTEVQSALRPDEEGLHSAQAADGERRPRSHHQQHRGAVGPAPQEGACAPGWYEAQCACPQGCYGAAEPGRRRDEGDASEAVQERQ